MLRSPLLSVIFMSHTLTLSHVPFVSSPPPPGGGRVTASHCDLSAAGPVGGAPHGSDGEYKMLTNDSGFVLAPGAVQDLLNAHSVSVP